MLPRQLFVAVIALLLSGCTGWAAESRLIPVAERDPAGLAGTYKQDDDRAVFAPGPDGLVRVTDPAGTQPGGDLAFALLREEVPEPGPLAEAIAAEAGEPDVGVPDRFYLMEIPGTIDDGKTRYFYGIVRIAFSPDGSADEVTQFAVVCSKAAGKLAARSDGKLCVFDDYADLRAAALAWYDDPRMALDTSTLLREDEEAAGPEPF